MATFNDNDLRRMYLEEGLNDYQVAKVLRVGRNRLREWRNANSILSKTNKKGLSKDICFGVVQRLESGETLSKISKELGVNRTSLARHLDKHGFDRPQYRPQNPSWTKDYQITEYQKEVLIGDLWGDGCLVSTSAKNAYYQCGHSTKQEFFVDWKYSVLSPLSSRKKFFPRHKSVMMGTWTSPNLGYWKRVFYPKGTKVLDGSLARFLTPMSLAVWYMGDGSRNRNTGVFHVGLHVDLEPIAKVLSKKFDLEFSARRYKKQWHLRVMEPAKFFTIICPWLLEGFRYKVPDHHQHLLDNQQPSLGGNPLEGSETSPISKGSQSL